MSSGSAEALGKNAQANCDGESSVMLDSESELYRVTVHKNLARIRRTR
jgi:hypothetical protein